MNNQETLEFTLSDILKDNPIKDLVSIFKTDLPVVQLTTLDFKESVDYNSAYYNSAYNNISSLQPVINTIMLETNSITIGSNKSTNKELYEMYGIQVDELIKSNILNEINQSIIRNTTKKIYEECINSFKLEEESKIKSLSFMKRVFRWLKKKIFKLLGKPFNDETIYTINANDLNKLKRYLNLESHKIAIKSRLGKGDIIITSNRIASILQNLPEFIMDPISTNSKHRTFYSIGSLENFKIYVDATLDWDDKRIFILRKNSLDQPGIKFVYTDPISIYNTESVDMLNNITKYNYRMYVGPIGNCSRNYSMIKINTVAV